VCSDAFEEAGLEGEDLDTARAEAVGWATEVAVVVVSAGATVETAVLAASDRCAPRKDLPETQTVCQDRT
tara:strand:- start:848 stop:1057 length:210 start_codon:yes stop_codon:yes gene_type:complete